VGTGFDSTNSVQIPLKPNTFKIDFMDSNIITNIKKDEYYCMIPLNITPTGNLPHIINACEVRIGSLSTDTSTFNVMIKSFGLYRFIQTENYGGFPAMPMSRLWYG
jgi:hypothetical protein